MVTWRPKAASLAPTTSEAPSLSAAAAWAGPASAPTAQALTRSETNAEGSEPSGGTRPLDITSTPARCGIEPPCAATALGSPAAGTAKATRSWRDSSRSEARMTLIASGSSTSGR